MNSSGNELDEFIYLISHDLQACVRALNEIPSWIREDLIDEGYTIQHSLARNLAMMDTATFRLDQMMRDLLEYSRVGRLNQSGTVDLNDALKLALKSVSIPDAFIVSSTVQGSAYNMGNADAHRLLRSLLENAIKHHDRSAGEVRVSAWHTNNDSKILVADDGLGIDSKLHEKVIQPMTTLRSRDEVEGSGMGLAISKKISEYYGGTLKFITGLQGRGVGVEVTIPRANCS